MIAQIMSLPSEGYIAEFMPVIDPQRIHEALRFVRASLAAGLKQELLDGYAANADNGPYRVDAQAVGRRSLRNVCLSYLMELDDAAIRRACLQQFEQGGNMTDVMAALHGLSNSDCAERPVALAAFHDRWRDDPLVMDKWLAIQASARLPGTLAAVRGLMTHPVFNIRNPNKVRALIASFCSANPRHFHDASGDGYAFLGDFLLQFDPVNPQVAARLVSVFSQWRRYDEPRQRMMQQQLQRLQALPGLSRDVYEIVSKSLAAPAVG
jgi:aminopeptidase N